MRPNSASARSSDAFALITSGTRFESNGSPGARPRRASIWPALASASTSWAEVSVSETRTRSSPCATRVPRSTGVAITRPVASALTSACSSATSEPVTRRNRSMGRLSTFTVVMSSGAGRTSAVDAALLLPHAVESTERARSAPPAAYFRSGFITSNLNDRDLRGTFG